MSFRSSIYLIITGGALLLSACQDQQAPARQSGTASDGAAQTSAAQSASLNQVLEDYFQASLALNPILATAIGVPGYDDQLPNVFSEAYRRENEAFIRHWLAQVKAIDRDSLSADERISYDIFIYQQEQELAGNRFPSHLLPLNQLASFPTFFAQMGSGSSLQPFKTAQNYQDWDARMKKAALAFDQAVSNMRKGIAQNTVQPRVVIEKALPQLDAVITANVEDSLFWQPITSFPEDFSDEQRQQLTANYRATIEQSLMPAYRRLRDFVRDEYLPATRTTVGWGELPNGQDWYNHLIASQTTTDLTADEVHDFGLTEVSRIRGEMEIVRQLVGYQGNLPSFFNHLRESDEFYFDTEEELLNGYRNLQAKIDAALPKLFDIFPKTNYEVRAVEAFRAESSAGASYQPGSPDGSRNGVFYVNTFNLKAQPKYGMETLSLHEASPGHHFQLTIQQEIENLPSFRRFGGFTAFAEGWALYAESLGQELGLFTDPYQYFGRLSDEQLRAMRLVVDTGLHAKGWSRAQAIQYMLNNSPMAESDAISEVERYIAIPGQALAYKVGERVIRELRSTAKAKLRQDFDIRAFHRLVLSGGAMPMDVLRQRINEWIDSQRNQA